jgi:hypothetical protein
MKNLFILTVFTLIALTSCKKDYTCNCSIVSDGVTISSSSTTIKDTKSKAKEACDAGDITETDFIFGVNCEIK